MRLCNDNFADATSELWVNFCIYNIGSFLSFLSQLSWHKLTFVIYCKCKTFSECHKLESKQADWWWKVIWAPLNVKALQSWPSWEYWSPKGAKLPHVIQQTYIERKNRLICISLIMGITFLHMLSIQDLSCAVLNFIVNSKHGSSKENLNLTIVHQQIGIPEQAKEVQVIHHAHNVGNEVFYVDGSLSLWRLVCFIALYPAPTDIIVT